MRQSFEPSIWGPKAWFFLETCIMAYPEKPTNEDKIYMKNFLLSLKFVIPCEKCRDNYSSHLKTYPLSDEVLSNRDILFKWIVDVHNSANTKKTKTYDETFNYYMSKYEGNNYIETHKSNYSKIIYLILITSFIVFIHYIYKVIKRKYQ